MQNGFLKLTVIGAFSAFAACAFFISQKPASAREDNILEAIAGYKTWKQINKPTDGLKLVSSGDLLTKIDVSSVAG